MTPNLQLKQERERRGWSQAQVATLLGTEASNIDSWESGLSAPPPYLCVKLCLLFERSARDLGFLPASIETPELALAEEPRQEPAVERAAVLKEELFEPALGARIIASLSYLFLWGSALLVFFAGRANRFICFHSLQSFFFFAGATLWYILYICIMFYTPSTILHLLALLISVLVSISSIAVWLIGIVQALRGRYTCVPLIGRLSLKVANKLSVK
ncbi:helix-turn-helix domain-containing protein [Ktedonosporobacter rubrisoli]|uniref:Helix-turn-helix domain-containing protein n=1 Tax=Ktedonosporobacter rubrisoli TaxID=2509675 RepID=A0A4P6JI01_KTERU|nr:helix-turn-helix domain-containing protein [Ktedonosporobacter rubrisoli]QBD74675.1 helix-turn-helix domain-containing protein [Ktedonosporobacter rubrisoli]